MRLQGIHAGAALRPLSRLAPFAFALFISIAALSNAALGVAPWFTPPPGWTATGHPRQLLGSWVHPGDASFSQNIVAGAARTSDSATQWDESMVPMLRSTLHNFVLGADADTTSCGRPAHYMSYASVELGRKIIYEHMTTVVNGVAFFVIYVRLASQPSLPEARAALTTLCGATIGQPSRPPVTHPIQPPPVSAPPNTLPSTPPPAPLPSVTTGNY